MLLFAWIELLVLWAAWLYPFLLRAPHNQKRASITMTGPTLVGLALECLAIAMALNIRLPANAPPGMPRMAASLVCGVLGIVLGWTAVTHLGRQFRIQAGLYEDHELVRTGPYAVVRHPIYASLLAMLLCTLLLLTPWPWALVAVAIFVAGTEVRVRTEDRLLESRFGDAFRDYRHRVPAYVPFVR
jgi:protein-S-isoprenylcysteine O-methyltransferase Ste14